MSDAADSERENKKMMKWKTEPQADGPDKECLYLGAYCVAFLAYDTTVHHEDNRHHVAYVLLPGHKKEATRFRSAETAKEAAETAVMIWISKAGLQPAEGLKSDE
ncbi:hypothetical protein C3D67_18385 [Cronobacter sakazakii]|nr:hypothetical protein C3D67_18385 [Cronobacter sakazakii]